MDNEKKEEVFQDFNEVFSEFLTKMVNEEIRYGDLIQECLGYCTWYSDVNCANPDEVDWFVRKMKQVALKEREEIFSEEELIH